MDESLRDVLTIAAEMVLAAAVCFIMLVFVNMGRSVYTAAVDNRALAEIPEGLLVSYQTKVVQGVDIVDVIDINSDIVDVVICGNEGGIDYEYIFAAGGNIDFTVGSADDFATGNDLASKLKVCNPAKYSSIDMHRVSGRPISEYTVLLRESNMRALLTPVDMDVWSPEFTQELMGSEINSAFVARVYTDTGSGETVRIEFWEM